MPAQKPIWIVMIAVTLMLATGCQNPSGGIFPIQSSRSVSLFARPAGTGASVSREIEGQGPLEIAAIMGFSFGESDSHSDNDILKVELDFGDGAGWTDYTQDLKTKWWKEPLSLPVYDPNWMTRHTYTEPGTFTVNGRMTYWDGQVINASSHTLVTVVVLP